VLIIKLINTKEQTIDTNLYRINPNLLKRISEWSFYIINIKQENNETFESITSILDSFDFNPCQYALHGKMLAISPELNKEIHKIKNKLSKLPRDSDSEILTNLRKEKLFEYESVHTLIKNIVGNLIRCELEKKGFTLLQKRKGCGRFKIPEIKNRNEKKLSNIHWVLEFNEKYSNNISIERTIEIGIIENKKEFKKIIYDDEIKKDDIIILCSIELKTQCQGKIFLNKQIEKIISRDKNLNLSYLTENNKKLLLKKLKVKNPKYKLEVPKNEIIPKKLTFFITSFKRDMNFKTQTSLINYKKIIRKKVSIREQLKIFGFSDLEINDIIKESKGMLAELKPFYKKQIDPNIKIFLPTSIIFESFSQENLIASGLSKKFTEFSSINYETRKRAIEYIIKEFNFNDSNSFIYENFQFKTDSIEYHSKMVNNKIIKDKYSYSPRILTTGIENFGKLKKIHIIYGIDERPPWEFKKFVELLKNTIQSIENASKNKTKIKIIYENYGSSKPEYFSQKIDNDSIVIVIGKKSETYIKFKVFYTLKRQQAVQYIKLKTLKKSVNYKKSQNPIILNIIKQIIAKAGGLVYKLQPIFDNAVIIGLDRARDPFNKALSASAGIAAFTGEGYYLGGASTKLDRQSHDFIDANELASKLIKKIKNKGKFKYLIILRDGDPRIAKDEVSIWKEYCDKNGIKLVYVASRKSHPLRIYPNENQEYMIPLVVKNLPTDENDFLILSVKAPRGTPKPVLYTIMFNGTEYKLDDLKNKVIKLLLDFSQLCWESTTSTSQPMPLHYADKLAEYTRITGYPWDEFNELPMFI